MTLLDAVAACSLRPARVLGIESERGTLRPGARADFAVLDDAARVTETWVEGNCVWRSG
jgi:N-acetylglucosamine-6-phosphate deacetylase